jgi:hypothetical protein
MSIFGRILILTSLAFGLAGCMQPNVSPQLAGALEREGLKPNTAISDILPIFDTIYLCLKPECPEQKLVAFGTETVSNSGGPTTEASFRLISPSDQQALNRLFRNSIRNSTGLRGPLRTSLRVNRDNVVLDVTMTLTSPPGIGFIRVTFNDNEARFVFAAGERRSTAQRLFNMALR